MRHHLDIIATNYRLDKKKFTEFALKPENYNKFGIINENGFVTTCTWFSNDLIEAFKKQEELCLKQE